MLVRGFHFLLTAFRIQPRGLETHTPTRWWTAGSVTLGLLLCSLPSAHADIITIDASRIESTSSVGYQPENPTLYGQTFTAPAGALRLRHFDFRMRLDPFIFFPERQIPFQLRGYVAPWDSATESISGTPLFTSDSRLVSQHPPVGDEGSLDARHFQLLSFNTESLAVSEGKQYVAFVTAFGFADPVSRSGFGLGTIALSSCRIEGCSGPGVNYPGGDLVFGEAAGPLATDVAFVRAEGQLDAAFRVTFDSAAPIPEPGTLLLLSAAGIAGFA